MAVSCSSQRAAAIRLESRIRRASSLTGSWVVGRSPLRRASVGGRLPDPAVVNAGRFGVVSARRSSLPRVPRLGLPRVCASARAAVHLPAAWHGPGAGPSAWPAACRSSAGSSAASSSRLARTLPSSLPRQSAARDRGPRHGRERRLGGAEEPPPQGELPPAALLLNRARLGS